VSLGFGSILSYVIFIRNVLDKVVLYSILFMHLLLLLGFRLICLGGIRHVPSRLVLDRNK